MIERSADASPLAVLLLHRMLRLAEGASWRDPAAPSPYAGLVRVPLRAAVDPAVADDLVAGGLRVAHIDCRRGDPNAWRDMAANVRRAAAGRHVPVKILMDVTGDAAAPPFGRVGRCAVLQLQPSGSGEQIEAASAQLVTSAHEGAHLTLDRIALPADFLNQLVPGDRIELVDALAARRKLRVVAVNEWGAVVRAKRPVALIEGTVLHFGRNSGAITALAEGSGRQPQGTDLPAIIALADLLAIPLPALEPERHEAAVVGSGHSPVDLPQAQAQVLVVEAGRGLEASLDQLLAAFGRSSGPPHSVALSPRRSESDAVCRPGVRPCAG